MIIQDGNTDLPLHGNLHFRPITFRLAGFAIDGMNNRELRVVQVKYHEPDSGASVSGKISTSAYEANINAYSLIDQSWL
jgi:hypothetical protein